MQKSINAQKFKVVNIILNKLSQTIFDENIIHIILHNYWLLLDNKRKVLLDWIPIDKLDLNILSLNLNAIDFLEENEDKIYWNNLSSNKNAIHLLENNLDKINWFYLSSNPSIFTYEPIPKII